MIDGISIGGQAGRPLAAIGFGGVEPGGAAGSGIGGRAGQGDRKSVV